MRTTGLFLSFLMAASFFLPWSDSAYLGSWSLLEVLQKVWGSYRGVPSIDIFDEVVIEMFPQGGKVSAVKLAFLVFAISFPLAASFSLFALLGYFSKTMGLLLGSIPVGLLSYIMFSMYKTEGLPVDLLDQIFANAREHMGIGLPTYLLAGILLFLIALVAPDRR